MLIDPSGNPSIPFTLYAMECEAELDTDRSKRNRVMMNLRDLARYTIVDEQVVETEFYKIVGYAPTEQEIQNILWEVGH